MDQAYYLKIEAPPACPNCGRNKPPHAHDYYPRGLVISGKKDVLVITIRRFHCHKPGCGITVTILPAFAQPYRLIHNGIIERFLISAIIPTSVQRWEYLFHRYESEFMRLQPTIQQALGITSRSLPRQVTSAQWLKQLSRKFGNLGGATVALVAQVGLTPFGCYKCHRPRAP